MLEITVFIKSHSTFKTGDVLKRRVISVTRSKSHKRAYTINLAVCAHLKSCVTREKRSPEGKDKRSVRKAESGRTIATQACSIFPLEASHLERFGEEEHFILFVAHC